MKTEIFVCTHKKFEPPKDSLYVPLQVGRALHPALGYLEDNQGDHISIRNPWFSELTGIYWVWKNKKDIDIAGICHYRRFLVTQKEKGEPEKLFQKRQIEDILKDYDMITSSLLTLPSKYYDGFAIDHHIKDLIMTGCVLQEKYPEDAKIFEKLVQEKHTYFGNIFVAKKEVYDQYCAWLFDILFEVQKRTDMTDYDGYTRRLYGFLSEFLLLVYTRARNMKVYEGRVAIIGEKVETREVKKQLEQFFLKGDYIEAKEFFLKKRAEKPDILMEASDITGELRLCMQIIATCEFEKQNIGKTILEYENRYVELIKFFRKLNRTIEHYKEGLHDEADAQFIRAEGKDEICVSNEAIEVAVRVICRDMKEKAPVLSLIYRDKSRK